MALLCACHMSLLIAEGGMINMQSTLMLIPNGPPKGAEEKAVDTAFFIPRQGSSGCLKINGTCGESALSPIMIMSREPPFPTTSLRTPGSELSLAGACERLILFYSVCQGAQATAAKSYMGSVR